MLQESLALTTTLLKRGDVTCEVTVIFKPTGLVTDGLFFIGKRLGCAVYETLIKKSVESFDINELSQRNAHYTYDSLIETVDKIIKDSLHIPIKTGTNVAHGDTINYLKVYSVISNKIESGFFIYSSADPKGSGKFFEFKKPADSYYFELLNRP